MKADMSALSNAHALKGGTRPCLAGTVSSASRGSGPGVSVGRGFRSGKQWFVLRVSYNRYRKAQNFLDENLIEYYLPMRAALTSAGKRNNEPLLPNLIFAYVCEETVKALVENNARNSVLSYYYNHFALNEFGKNPPLVVPEDEMLNFINVTSVDNEHIMIVDPRRCHYKSGDKVKIVGGDFKGVEGKVARVSGQQRVVVEIQGLCLIATAYIPTAFIEPIK